jgi:hypothetical protein
MLPIAMLNPIAAPLLEDPIGPKLPLHVTEERNEPPEESLALPPPVVTLEPEALPEPKPEPLPAIPEVAPNYNWIFAALAGSNTVTETPVEMPAPALVLPKEEPTPKRSEVFQSAPIAKNQRASLQAEFPRLAGDIPARENDGKPLSIDCPFGERHALEPVGQMHVCKHCGAASPLKRYFLCYFKERAGEKWEILAEWRAPNDHRRILGPMEYSAAEAARRQRGRHEKKSS